jgi:hypothetical protein
MSGRLKDRVESEATRLLRARVEHFRRSLEQALASLGEELRLPLTPGEWGAAGGTAHLNALRDAVEAVSRGTGQRDILSALLDGAAAMFPRAAIFIVKGNSLAGWAGLGFDGAGGFSNKKLQKISLSAAGEHLMARALNKQALAEAASEGPGTDLVGAFGSVHPRRSAAAPLLVRGRPAAVLYADSGAVEESGQGFALEILARTAGLAMERLAAAAARPARPAELVAPSGDLTQSAADRIPPASGASPPPPEEAEIQALIGDITSTPRRAGSDDGLSEEARRMQADARRFAKLLVSELLLYNEEAVVLGRKNRDLQTRLAKEIHRSREAFQARVHDTAGSSGFFEEELVRVLAQGNPTLMGKN